MTFSVVTISRLFLPGICVEPSRRAHRGLHRAPARLSSPISPERETNDRHVRSGAMPPWRATDPEPSSEFADPPTHPGFPAERASEYEPPANGSRDRPTAYLPDAAGSR